MALIVVEGDDAIELPSQRAEKKRVGWIWAGKVGTRLSGYADCWLQKRSFFVTKQAMLAAMRVQGGEA
jgi:hypothetical protein